MKFTDKEALENLKSILTNNGKKPLRMSEKSVERQLEILMPLIANDEMELNDFVGKVKDTFSVMNSNAEKDNSTFIKNWENEHKPVETKVEEPKEEPKNEGDSLFAQLQQQIDEMKQELESTRKANSLSAKRKELVNAMVEKGIKDETWIDDFLGEISINEDMDVNAKADSYLKIYNKSKANVGEEETSPKSSVSGNKNKEAHRFDYIKAEFEKEQERNKNLI